jgi:2-polyprenyl-3-methyl-5-hydroxy-6-metoxy-1,4-benzoquinol methylase
MNIKDYNLNYALSHQKNRGGEFFKIAELIGRLEAKAKVLDIGCNTGELLGDLDKQFQINGMGIDLNAQAIGIAQKSFPPIKFIEGNFLRMEIKGEFDLILAVEVIEHIEEFKEFLNKVYSLLSKKGLFILSTPNQKAYFTKIRKFLLNIKDDPTHLREFSVGQLEEILSSNNFKIIQVFTAPSGIPLLGRIFPKLNTLITQKWLWGTTIFVKAQKI